MKILLDQNLDEQFAKSFPGHQAHHVKAMGWAGIQNGELLAKAQEGGFDVFITVDKNMRHQQNLKGRRFCLIVLDIHPNALDNQVACLPMIEEHLKTAKPGEVYVLEGPHLKRQ